MLIHDVCSFLLLRNSRLIEEKDDEILISADLGNSVATCVFN